MQPVVLNDREVAFPTNVVDRLMVPYAQIPKEYKNWNNRNRYSQFVSDWFFKGIDPSILVAKPGIDRNTALRHIQAVISSWAPKHEHKEACCAYLLSLWFDIKE